MGATVTMLAAFGLGIVGRWAHNRPAVTRNLVLQGAFALVVIAMLDQGRTRPVARGFAALFLVAVLLGDSSPVTGIAQAIEGKSGKLKGK